MKVDEFINSDDPHKEAATFELDYAFRGAYKRKEEALESFANSVLEQEGVGVDVDDFFDPSGNILPDVNDDTLEKFEWKLIEAKLK